MATVAHALTHHYNGDPFERVIYTESHDEVANGKARIPHEIAPGDPSHWAAQKRSTLGAALMFTAPGIPMLFQGQEFLQGEWFQDTVPLDWDQSRRVPRHRAALPRPDPAAARPRRPDRRPDGARRQGPPHRRGEEARRLPPLGRGRARRRRGGGGELQRRDPRRLPDRLPAAGASGRCGSTPTGPATATTSPASTASTSRPRRKSATAWPGRPRLLSGPTPRWCSRRTGRRNHAGDGALSGTAADAPHLF